MKLIIMTKPTFFVEEDKILTTLFEEGLEILHLNKPQSEPVYSERLLTLLHDDYYHRIVVHNHFYLREEYGLRGIHLSTPAEELPYGYKGRVSSTCQRIDDLKMAKKHTDYVFLETIFDSNSNPARKQTHTLEELRQAARRGLIDRHVYAMGGITADNLRLVRDMGFGGAVVCGDLWNRFNIHQGQDYKELMDHFHKLQRIAN